MAGMNMPVGKILHIKTASPNATVNTALEKTWFSVDLFFCCSFATPLAGYVGIFFGGMGLIIHIMCHDMIISEP